jgi:hypothetical protein
VFTTLTTGVVSDLDINAIKLPNSDDGDDDNDIVILDHDPSCPPLTGETDSG